MNIFSVSEITKYIKQLFECDSRVANLLVRGEISNFKHHFSGHCYFTVKDRNATIRAVMFKSHAQFLKFEPKDGMKVIAGGQITVFERDGQYQLYVQRLVPEGIGELSLAFAQLKEKLEAEGLFADIHKKPLPMLPERVGIVTSATGAVLRDIITVSKRRHPAVVLTLYPVLVQGPEAPMQIVHAVEVFNRLANVDVIIVGRGGGSIEDLWAFNDERVVRAVANSEAPVITGVGHETDFTLADFAADVRAPTPTGAAVAATPDQMELKADLTGLVSELESAFMSKLQGLSQLYHQIKLDLQRNSPFYQVQNDRQRLDDLELRLGRASRQRVVLEQTRLQGLLKRLATLGPESVLERGYAIVARPDGSVIRQKGQVNPGQPLVVRVSDGRFNVEVK
jgi:exodeoxyribonuclease VII large subunit